MSVPDTHECAKLEEELAYAKRELDEIALATGYGERPEGQDHVIRASGEEIAAKFRALEAEAERLATQKDGAYSERNQILPLLARMAFNLGWRVGVGRHPESDAKWEADWRTILFIDLPHGQASWHFHDSEKHLLAGLPEYPHAWDGHSNEEKYERVRASLVPSDKRRCAQCLFANRPAPLLGPEALEKHQDEECPSFRALRGGK